jgi:hydrogenase nickel incorporation protein HypA/HybF
VIRERHLPSSNGSAHQRAVSAITASILREAHNRQTQGILLRRPAALHRNKEMHELSIVAAVLEQLSQWREQHGGTRITKVGLRVGELAGVDLDCLRFGFDCSVKETEWEPLALEIEPVARRQQCPRCMIEFEAGAGNGAASAGAFASGGQVWPPDAVAGIGQLWTAMPFTACPACGEPATRTIAGEELQIAYIEVEEK